MWRGWVSQLRPCLLLLLPSPLCWMSSSQLSRRRTAMKPTLCSPPSSRPGWSCYPHGRHVCQQAHSFSCRQLLHVGMLIWSPIDADADCLVRPHPGKGPSVITTSLLLRCGSHSISVCASQSPGTSCNMSSHWAQDPLSLCTFYSNAVAALTRLRHA